MMFISWLEVFIRAYVLLSHLLMARNTILINDVLHEIKQSIPMKMQSEGRLMKYVSPAKTP